MISKLNNEQYNVNLKTGKITKKRVSKSVAPVNTETTPENTEMTPENTEE